MIQHIVLFKLYEPFMQKQVKLELFKLKELSYFNNLEIIEGYVHNSSKGDLILNSVFDNQDQLDLYMKDPLHLNVIKETSPFIESKQVIDFFI